MKDEPGVLSAVLNIFARTGGNILTINQGIPVSGCAAVTIGAETSGLEELGGGPDEPCWQPRRASSGVRFWRDEGLSNPSQRYREEEWIWQ